MSHIWHPDSHTHGLCDACPECRSKAESGQGFDRENLHRILVAKIHHTATDRLAYQTLLARQEREQQTEMSSAVREGVANGLASWAGLAVATPETLRGSRDA